MFRQAHQCVVCGFSSKRGSLYNGNFMCSACEKEQLEEECIRAEEEEYAEVDRLTYFKWNMA